MKEYQIKQKNSKLKLKKNKEEDKAQQSVKTKVKGILAQMDTKSKKKVSSKKKFDDDEDKKQDLNVTADSYIKEKLEEIKNEDGVRYSTDKDPNLEEFKKGA